MARCVSFIFNFLAASLCVTIIAANAAAAPQDFATDTAGADTPPYSHSVDTKVSINPDLTAIQETTVRIKVLRESAIHEAGEQNLNYEESVDPREVEEAYTEKANGKRIAVDPVDILTRDRATGLDAVFTRDAKVKTIIFPDVEVGDTVVLRSKTHDIDRTYPGHYYLHYYLARSVPYDSFRLTVDEPAGLHLNAKTRGTGITETVSQTVSGRRLTFTYSSKAWVPDEPNAVSWLDQDPEIVLTNFKDYKDLGSSYWASMSGKAIVTPEIQALANDITRGMNDKREQAAAISRWVKKNIRYVLVTLGSGGITPNPAPAILKNKYGDCKDHMVLMTALLQAKGIESEPALINLDTNYKLAGLPVPFFNHVIVHIPELGIYDDPTAASANFGVLADVAYDKPVLLLTSAGGRLARTPAMKPDGHRLMVKTLAQVGPDGTVQGETFIRATGIFASDSRSEALSMQRKGRSTYAEALLRGLNHPGKGTFDKALPFNYEDPYTVHGKFLLADKLEMPLAGLRDIPTGMPLQAEPVNWFFGARVDGRKSDFICLSGKQTSEISVTFAEGLPLPKELEPLKISNKYFDYTEASSVEGRTLNIRREFASNVQGQVCPSELEAEIGGQLKQVLHNEREQMTFSPTRLTAQQ